MYEHRKENRYIELVCHVFNHISKGGSSVKNVHKSALALTFLMASAANALDWPAVSMPELSMPEANVTNAALGVAAAGCVYGAYKYRKNIKNALGTAASAAKSAAISIKDAIINNPVKSAVLATVAIAAVAYKYYPSNGVVAPEVDGGLNSGSSDSQDLPNDAGNGSDVVDLPQSEGALSAHSELTGSNDGDSSVKQDLEFVKNAIDNLGVETPAQQDNMQISPIVAPEPVVIEPTAGDAGK